MSIKLLKGTVQNLKEGFVAKGHIQQRGGLISSSEPISFRIEPNAVSLKLDPAFNNQQISLKEGDEVTVVGKRTSDGRLKARAIRNDKTGMIYAPAQIYYWAGFVSLWILGSLIGPNLISFIGIACSFAFVAKALSASNAKRILTIA